MVLSLFDSFFSFLEEGEGFIEITVDVIVVDASLQINKINVFLFLRRVSELAFEKDATGTNFLLAFSV